MTASKAPPFRVRLAGSEDAAALAALSDVIPKTPRWSEIEMRRLLNGGGLAVLAPNAGYALARLAADEADLLAVGVAAPHRAKGLGATLLRSLETAAAARGAAVVHLDVSETNAPARRLYVKAGYDVVGRRDRYYSDGSAAILMARRLSPTAP